MTESFPFSNDAPREKRALQAGWDPRQLQQQPRLSSNVPPRALNPSTRQAADWSLRQPRTRSREIRPPSGLPASDAILSPERRLLRGRGAWPPLLPRLCQPHWRDSKLVELTAVPVLWIGQLDSRLFQAKRMFLTMALLRNRIPGKQWIGKYRRPRKVSMGMIQRMIQRLEIEAENEYWLSRPYMTQEQEYCHNQERRQARREALIAERKANFPEHKYATEHLNHLNVSKKW